VGHYELAESMLRAAGPGLRIVMHSFAGSYEVAAKFLELGAHISFSGSVLRKKPEVLERLVNLIPQDRLLCETDSPDQRPDFWRQKHNEPAALYQIGEYLADIRHTSLEELSHKMYNNCNLLFAKNS
jgi:TatD DNase family protein